MHLFLSDHRDELIARCQAKVARRPLRAASQEPLASGVANFLDHLIATLRAEAAGDVAQGRRISGAAGGDAAALSPMGVAATAHGRDLLERGYTVDQVVHDYGDLCQAITDLAIERQAPFSVDQFRTLNRCLDNAIADAVTGYSAGGETSRVRRQTDGENERLGVLVHELRNALQTATLAFAVLESGKVPIAGSTGALMKRSLGALSGLLDRALGDVRLRVGPTGPPQPFTLAAFLAEAGSIASLGAPARGCTLSVTPVDATIVLAGHRDPLLAALVNLLQNAFKFSHADTVVSLHAAGVVDRVEIEVRDHCGGLPPGFAEAMFRPFTQGGVDRSGLGLGLVIARRSVEADGGSLTVRDVPGTGCVFTMSLPRHVA